MDTTGIDIGNLAAATGTGPAPISVKSVAICDTQPVTAQGVRNLLSGIPDLTFLIAPESLQEAAEAIRLQDPDVMILDKGFGIQAILDWLTEIHAKDGTPLRTGIVVWGVSVTEAEALRFLQAGARGILRKSAGVQAVVACLRSRGYLARRASQGDRFPVEPDGNGQTAARGRLASRTRVYKAKKDDRQ